MNYHLTYIIYNHYIIIKVIDNILNYGIIFHIIDHFSSIH